MAEKTALIAHGGALKTAYAGGFLYQLGKSGLTSFDYVVGTSASTGNAAYFVTGQYNELKVIWLDYLAKRRDFVSFKRFFTGKPIIDVHYLMSLSKLFPLDLARLTHAPSKLVIPMYNQTLRRREYYSNRDPDAVERIYDALQIGMTIHKDHTVEWGGNAYADSEIEPYALYCDTVLEDTTHALVIRNDSDETFDFAKRFGTWLYRSASGRGISEVGHELLRRREELFHENKRCFEAYRESRQVYLHTPSPEAKINWLSLVDGRESSIRRIFEAGEHAALQFLSDTKTTSLVKALRARSDELQRV